jgi:large subunit ribosomal protein L21
MLAVIKTGGKQYLVQPGDKIKIEKLDNKEGDKITFSEVLLVQKDLPDGKAGKKIEIGKPIVKDAEVHAKVLSQGKADKVVVYKYKSKKRYSKKTGHRQQYTEIEITGIK